MEVITWGGESGLESQPLPFVVSGLVVWGFLTVPFVLLHVFWNRQIARASTRFSGGFLRGFRFLTWIAWINICLLPAIMMFFPLWTVRLVCSALMGVYFLCFLYGNWKGDIQVIDPYIIDEIQKAVEELKPAIYQEVLASHDENHLAWAKEATVKLDQMISRLRGKDDGTGSA